MLTSQPHVKPQPETPTYGLDVLELLTATTREEYEAAGGPLVPYSPIRPLQAWFITNALGPYFYTGIKNPGTGVLTLERFQTNDCGSPNFRGLPNYPAYFVAETSAMHPHAAPAAPTHVDKNTLSTLDEATALQLILGGKIADEGAVGLVLNGIALEFPIDYGSETRRAYALQLANGKQVNVGMALGQMYAKGIGWPGKFVPDAGQVSGISFQFDTLDDGAGASDVGALPVPCRELNTYGAVDEVLITQSSGSILGSQVTVIARTDLMTGTSTQTGPTAASNAAVLTAIADFRKWLEGKIGA